jgi:chromosome segregation ATPase
VKFFGKSIGGRGGNVSGENQDLGELQREKAKREAALSETQSRIAAIEAEVTRKREEKEQKERELASLQKKLKACKDGILWMENRVSELKQIAHGQEELLLAGRSEPFFSLKATLQEIAEWKRELELLREFEVSLPQEIEKLEALLA